MGHSKASITFDVYGHLISDIDAGAAEMMDSVITPIEVKPGAETAPERNLINLCRNGGLS